MTLQNSLTMREPIDFVVGTDEEDFVGSVTPTMYTNIVAEGYKNVDTTVFSRRSMAAILHATLVNEGVPAGCPAIKNGFEAFLKHQLKDIGVGPGVDPEEGDDEDDDEDATETVPLG